MKFSLLASTAILGLAIAVPAPPAPTARAVLPDSLPEKQNLPPVCSTTKTLYGPYNINFPMLGYSKADEFYAVKLQDGSHEIAVKDIKDAPLEARNWPGVWKPKGGDGWGDKGGDEPFHGSFFPTSKTWALPTFTIPWPKPTLPSWGTCIEKMTVVTSGQWGFPTDVPRWPELDGAKVRPVEAKVTSS